MQPWLLAGAADRMSEGLPGLRCDKFLTDCRDAHVDSTKAARQVPPYGYCAPVGIADQLNHAPSAWSCTLGRNLHLDQASALPPGHHAVYSKPNKAAL